MATTKKTVKAKPKVTPPPPVAKNGNKYAYKVESGIKVQGVRSHGLTDKFPFEMMQIGDSFLIPKSDEISKKPNTLHYAAKQYARMKPGFTLTSRMQLDGARRVWRLK